MTMKFKLPSLEQRTAVIGMTGSGKSVFGMWLLSLSRYDQQPFIIIDFKHETIVQRIHHAREIGYNELPKKPGVYILRPDPDDGDNLEKFLRAVWRRGKTGIMYDETAELPKHFGKGAVHAIQTQGRSKRIPVIACTQRPLGVAPSIFTEANYFACFFLQKPEDVAAFARYTPWNPREIVDNPLPQHYCHWYDQPRRWSQILRPCPDEETILETFDQRLRPRKWFL
jgi:hypothetical protein